MEQDLEAVEPRRHISEVIRDNMRRAPPEILAVTTEEVLTEHLTFFL